MAPGATVISEVTIQNGQAEKPTVYILDQLHPKVMKYCQQHFNTVPLGSNGHQQWRENARYLLIRSARLTAEDIDSCPNLIAIGKQGVGIDKIDANACSARGIKIFNTPGVNSRAVAETVLMLAMAVSRQVGRISNIQNSGMACPKEKCSGLLLHQKSIGIIGMGNIGKNVAHIFRGAFESPIITYDPFLPSDAWPDLPHHRAPSVEEVFMSADIITLHVPLTEATRGLISYTQMQKMKRSAIVINTARGGIVNERDLERALKDGLIWGAGLDCHEQEPPTKERYGALWDLGVVSTPHIGAATEQTQVETGLAAAKYLYEFAQTQAV